MPRIGDVYSPPYDPVVSGTPIESVEYNGTVADIAVDLNTPRPISAGGTGADNAAEAMSNLGGEGSKIQVTNYDSHNFTAGSFYSLASATAPPVAGHAFAGICYPAVVAGVATSDMFIEVRDRDEPTQPGSSYVRQKKAGVWSGWLKAVGTASGITPPSPASSNALWWDPARGKLFIYYVDGDTSQWVEAVAVPEIDEDEITDAVDAAIDVVLDTQAVRYDVAQTLTEAQDAQGRENIYAAPLDALAYSGMQINGSMEVSQENGVVNVNMTPATTKHVVDGFDASIIGATRVAIAVQQPITSLPGFPAAFGFNCTTPAALGAGDAQNIFQQIEGYRWARLGWGTASAQPITIGFWVNTSVAGTLAVSVRNAAANRSHVVDVPYTGGTWQYKTVTIPGCTDGVWATGNTAAAIITFCFGSGATFQAAANAWVTTNSFATSVTTNLFSAVNGVYITGVVVLPGIEAPSAERSALIMRPYNQELLTCQRYYYRRLYPLSGAYVATLQAYSTTTAAGAIFDFPVPMRAAPAVTANGNFALLTPTGSSLGLATNALTATVDYAYNSNISVASGLVAGNATVLHTTAVNSTYSFDARL